MSMWTAIVLIVIAGTAGQIWKSHVDNRKSGAHRDELKILKDRLDALDTELRDRVETLERIVTDRKEDLKRQFDYIDKAG